MSKAWESSNSLHSVLTTVRCADAVYQVPPTSTTLGGLSSDGAGPLVTPGGQGGGHSKTSRSMKRVAADDPVGFQQPDGERDLTSRPGQVDVLLDVVPDLLDAVRDLAEGERRAVLGGGREKTRDVAGDERLELDEAPAQRRRREHDPSLVHRALPVTGAVRAVPGESPEPLPYGHAIVPRGWRSSLDLLVDRALAAAAEEPRPAMSKRAWLQFAGIAVIWGLPYFFIRIAVRDLDPGTLVCFRTGLASLILLPFVVHRRKWRELVKHWPAVLAYTLTEITVPWFLLATAEQKLSSSLAGLLVATVPIFGLLIAWALGHERPGARRVSGLILGFAGVVILAGVGVKGSSLVSMGEVVLCSIGYAIAPMIVSRRLAKAPSFEVVAASMVVTALIYLPFALTHLPRRFHAETAESVVTLSVVCTVLAFMVFFALIKEIGPTPRRS